MSLPLFVSLPLLPLHWQPGDVCEVRGARATVRTVMADGYAYVEFGGGRSAVMALELLELPALPPVDDDERLFTRREMRRRG